MNLRQAFALLVAAFATTEAKLTRATKPTETNTAPAGKRRIATSPDARQGKALHNGKVAGAPNATTMSIHGNLTNLHPSILSPKSVVEKPLSHDDYTTPPSCSEAYLYFQTDSNLYDTFVTLTDLYTGDLIWSTGGDAYSESGNCLSSGCLDPYGCYLFQFIDTAGDGLCCDYGFGYFNLYYNDNLVLYGDTEDTFGPSGTSSTIFLGDGCYFV